MCDLPRCTDFPSRPTRHFLVKTAMGGAPGCFPPFLPREQLQGVHTGAQGLLMPHPKPTPPTTSTCTSLQAWAPTLAERSPWDRLGLPLPLGPVSCLRAEARRTQTPSPNPGPVRHASAALNRLPLDSKVYEVRLNRVTGPVLPSALEATCALEASLRPPSPVTTPPVLCHLPGPRSVP